jgi:hypothetical protein
MYHRGATAHPIHVNHKSKSFPQRSTASFVRKKRKGELLMRISRNLTAFAAALLLAAGAFAANATQGKLHVYEAVRIQGKALQPGNYKVEWNGQGPDVQVTILSGKETVATLPAKLVPTNNKNTEDGYSSAKQSDGTNDLQTIFFHGTTFELQVSQQAVNGAPQTGTSGNN